VLGSLDAPPIRIRTSRTFSGIGFAISAALFVLNFQATSSLFLFGLSSLYFGWQLLSPSELILQPSGLTWKNTFKSRHWAWRDVSNFREMYWGFIGCDLSDDKPAVSWLRPINKTVAGSQGSFGFGWEGGVSSVISTLTVARSRWL
jgi:hypothetical protein